MGPAVGRSVGTRTTCCRRVLGPPVAADHGHRGRGGRRGVGRDRVGDAARESPAGGGAPYGGHAASPGPTAMGHRRPHDAGELGPPDRGRAAGSGSVGRGTGHTAGGEPAGSGRSGPPPSTPRRRAHHRVVPARRLRRLHPFGEFPAVHLGRSRGRDIGAALHGQHALAQRPARGAGAGAQRAGANPADAVRSTAPRRASCRHEPPPRRRRRDEPDRLLGGRAGRAPTPTAPRARRPSGDDGGFRCHGRTAAPHG